MDYFEDRESRELAIKAAMLGCAICGAPVRVPPAGDPFSSGPWRGRFLCADCWVLYYSEHTEHLADQATVTFIKKEAERIRLERASQGAEVIFQEGASSVVLTSNGTLAFNLERTEGRAPEEYDTARFELLLRALEAVHQAGVAGFSLKPI